MKVLYDDKLDVLRILLTEAQDESPSSPGLPNPILEYDDCGQLVCMKVPNFRVVLSGLLKESYLSKERELGVLIPSSTGSAEQLAEPEKVEPLEIQLGSQLVRLADSRQQGDLVPRLQIVRRELGNKLGIFVPAIRVRDNLALQGKHYRIKVRSATVAESKLLPDHVLAMDPGGARQDIGGMRTREPAYGLEAVWLPRSEQARAEGAGYTVVVPEAVLTTHLTELITRYAADLLTREDVHRLMKSWRQVAPNAVDDVMDSMITVGEVHRVLQYLLQERVSIRDFESILEALGDSALMGKSLETLAEDVRLALARQICADYADEDQEIWCVTLSPELERMIADAMSQMSPGESLPFPRPHADAIARETAKAVEPIHTVRRSPAVLTSRALRRSVWRITRGQLAPQVPVLSHEELPPEVSVRPMGVVSVPREWMARPEQKGSQP